jgi:BASS family bile acid:Na+ symporter
MSQNIFADVFLPVTLAIITFGLGLSITVQDLKNIFIQPRNIIIGLSSQILVLPIIAFLIAVITKMDAEYAVGLVILSICPGGATSNLVNYMIRGNVALSLSLTVVNSLITIFTIPLLTKLALNTFLDQEAMIHLSFSKTVLQIFLLTVVPASTGILIRIRNKDFAKRMENPLRFTLPVLLFIVYSGVIFFKRGESGTDFRQFFSLLPYTLSLNFISMFAGYYIPGIFNVTKNNRFTIAVEVGLHNSTLGIFVAGSLLNNYKMALVGVVYGSFSFFTTWLFGYIARKYL